MERFQFSAEDRKVLKMVQVNMPWRHLPRYLELILSNRINPEIGFGGEELDHATRSECRAVAEKLRRHGCRLTLHGPFWDLCTGSVDPLIRQVARFRLQQFFDLMSILNPVQVVCHTGYDFRHHGFDRKGWLERSLSIWEPLVEQAERMQIPLLIENVWEDGPELHLELLKRASSPYFGFCLDVGHQHSFSRTPLSVWLESLVDFLGEIHLHDNDGRRDAHLPVGKGNIDFEFLFRFLRSRGKSPVLTLEPHNEADFQETLSGLAHILALPSLTSEAHKD
jgi:sugar phosphate isomerase/epimerase